MSAFEEYLEQSFSNTVNGHYDEHTDRWIDEGHLPYGNSGHCDVHSDTTY